MTQKPNNASQNKRKEDNSPELMPFFSHKRVFQGFAPPTSNTLYCPNQFFDVCLPHRSRGCARLVGYMLRRTLGWSDEDGNPLEEQVIISYSDLVKNAGISREMIRSAIDEAVEYNFIVCRRKGQAKTKGQTSISALYELRWDEAPEYVKNPDQYQGFFAGEGNRTYIPLQFFDDVLRVENLSVTKVVASVIRFSIGFQTKHGFRRKHVELSFNHIQRYARITGRSTLATAVRTALERNYIVRIQEGLFTPDVASQVTTTYSLKWLDRRGLPHIGQKIVPGQDDPDSLIGQKIVPGKSSAERSENRTRVSQKKRPGKRSENRTSIEITTRNNTLKQQQGQRVAVDREVLSILQGQGLSKKDATALAETYPEKLIRKQIEWLPARNPRNPAGMLRTAIQEEWTAPTKGKCQSSDIAQGEAFAAAYYAGFAGNKDAPTAQPSSKEITAATLYVDQLLKMWPEAGLIEAHGRALGAYVREKKPATKDFRATFTMALRLFGDEFYKNLQHQRVAEVQSRAAAQRKAHSKKYLHTYKAFVVDEEKHIKTKYQARYSEFLEKRAEHRTRLENSRFVRSEDERRKSLQQHDSDRARLNDFLDVFHDDVADFWTWDAEHNPEAFRKVDTQ